MRTGVIALEIGYDQKDDITAIVKNCGKYKSISCIKDLYGNDRVVIINS